MPRHADIRLVECFYEAVARPQMLAQGLQRVGEILDGERVSLYLWDRRTAWGMASHAVFDKGEWQLQRNDSELPDPALRRLARKIDHAHWARLGNKPHARSAVGAATMDGAAPGGLLCLRIALADAEALLTLQRTARKWDDAALRTAQATDLCRLLVPALETIARLRHLSRQVLCLSSLLDSVRMPMMLLDASLRPLATNAAAATIVRRAPAAGHGKTVVSLPGIAPSQLAHLVERACAQPATGGVIPFRAGRDAPTAHLLVLPLRVPAGDLPHPAALLLVQGLSGLPEQSQLLLQRVYGLTPAEARLAQLILDGQSPLNAATTLRVSVTTIRTQLSAVLKKTGAQRQSDLVRQLSPLMMLGHLSASGAAGPSA